MLGSKRYQIASAKGKAGTAAAVQSKGQPDRLFHQEVCFDKRCSNSIVLGIPGLLTTCWVLPAGYYLLVTCLLPAGHAAQSGCLTAAQALPDPNQSATRKPARESDSEQPKKDRAQLPIAVKDRSGHMSQRGTAKGAKQGLLCSAVVPGLCDYTRLVLEWLF